MAQLIIRRPTTGGTFVDSHVDADRALLERLLQEAIAARGKGFWADENATVFAGRTAHDVAANADAAALAAKIIP